jgi:hypothetical protein
MLAVRQIFTRGSTTMDVGWRDLAPVLLVFVLGPLVALPIYLGLKALVRRAFGKPRYCLACGATTIPKPHYRGSFLVESALFDLFVLPGLLYSGWRLKTRRMVCAACGSEQIVPPSSPEAMVDDQRRAKESP